MLPRLDSIKNARVKLGITQQKLASLTGVSTSMINQIESGRCQPSYTTAKKIFEVLNSLEGQSSKKTGEICSRDIIKCKSTDSLQDAIKKMQSHSISQIPVFEDSDPVGLITEDGIVKHLTGGSETERRKTKLLQIMEPSPPIIDYNIPASTLVSLIRYSKCILVSRRGKIYGIITASDALRML